MTAGRLIEMLKEVHPDTPVYLLSDEEGEFFRFMEACEEASGETEIAPIKDGIHDHGMVETEEPMTVFAICPHGALDEDDDADDYQFGPDFTQN